MSGYSFSRSLVAWVLAAGFVFSTGCRKKADPSPGPIVTDEPVAGIDDEARPPKSKSTVRSAAATATPFPVITKPPPAALWKEFSGASAFAAVKTQVDLGPRPAGSAELDQARKWITAELERYGWEVEAQEFTDETPRGPVKFVNLIARFSADGARPVPRQTQQAIVASHYDTKRFSTIRFLGANDGGSSTGALIELARVLSFDPKLAAQIELVFFDGEEAVVQFSETDGLYGSRHYAASLRDTHRAPQFRFGILWDMIGDHDLTITLPPDSPRELANGILESADALGLRSHFSYLNREILDDHVSLTRVHIPTIDLIDFDFLYWHTADDKIERVSPESLQKIGAVTVHYLCAKLNR